MNRFIHLFKKNHFVSQNLASALEVRNIVDSCNEVYCEHSFWFFNEILIKILKQNKYLIVLIKRLTNKDLRRLSLSTSMKKKKILGKEWLKNDKQICMIFSFCLMRLFSKSNITRAAFISCK
jgi:hypothetical protein